jgi:hypothetical protein
VVRPAERARPSGVEEAEVVVGAAVEVAAELAAAAARAAKM